MGSAAGRSESGATIPPSLFLWIHQPYWAWMASGAHMTRVSGLVGLNVHVPSPDVNALASSAAPRLIPCLAGWTAEVLPGAGTHSELPVTP